MKKHIRWIVLSLCAFSLIYYSRYLVSFAIFGVAGVFDTSIKESQKKDFLICTYRTLPFEYQDSLTSFSIEPDQVWQSYFQWVWDKEKKKFGHGALRGLHIKLQRNGTKHQDIPWDIGWDSLWETKRSGFLITIWFPDLYADDEYEDWLQWYSNTMTADTLHIPIVSAVFNSKGKRTERGCMDWQNIRQKDCADSTQRNFGELVLIRMPEESRAQEKQ